MSNSVLGWDIGGVNTKVALVTGGELRDVLTRPFELQRAPDTLSDLLVDMAGLLGGSATAHAVTMTAELSQMFRTKRAGVHFVLDAVERAFPDAAIHVWTTEGRFVTTLIAREHPLSVAAANWMATASVVARQYTDALLVDIGTTTTDLIPIVDGRIVAIGRTDPQRLASGELLYTGAVRTPVEAILREVPVADTVARVSAERFALAGDVHVWLEHLDPRDYDCGTPDSRPATREFAGERLARVVCADTELLDENAITRIARAAADAQAAEIAVATSRICARHGLQTAVVTGLGSFIAERAAHQAGLQIVRWSSRLGTPGARSAPAAAVALLLADQLQPLTVIKLGGSLLADPEQWRAAVAAIAALASSHRLVVVPGGGPFADRVRWIDAHVGLSDDAAHWMAIAAMDQHAEMIATAPAFRRVVDRDGIRTADAEGDIPVVALLSWLRAADPLPHSWAVTSDSIAAWLAGTLQAQRLVLIKSAGANGGAIVDDYFAQALPAGLRWDVCAASDLEALLKAGERARR